MTLTIENFPDSPFGATARGIDLAALADEANRQALRDAFEDRGLVVFEGVEGPEMQMELSKVFGPIKDHPIPAVDRVEGAPQVIDMRYDPGEGHVFEMEGEQVAHWLPWHFDHCYNDELNRAGVLRPVTITSTGGLTGFMDGVQVWHDLPQDIRDKAEGLEIVYKLELAMNLRFARPEGLRAIRVGASSMRVTSSEDRTPRAIHPLVFARDDGRKVLHFSPWMALGVAGDETPAGDALLTEIADAMLAAARPYFHAWKPDQMLIWDNWRMLHMVTGHPIGEPRRMQRTTIKGDYGLGRFENGEQGTPELQMTV